MLLKTNAPIWIPEKKQLPNNSMKAFQDFVVSATGEEFSDYSDFHNWSISELSGFWECIANFFEVQFDTPFKIAVLPGIPFYQTKWFTDATVSYTHHIERNFNHLKPVIFYRNEKQDDTTVTWNALFKKAKEIQDYLLKAGIKKGDCVVGYLTHHPVTIAAFFAVNSLGAIWSCCSPDFGVESVLNRFGQLNPKILFAMSEYSYNGNNFILKEKVEALKQGLPNLENTLVFDTDFSSWDLTTREIIPLKPLSVSFDHPIWVLFSSGTTGQPKAITHRTGGMLLEQFKALSLHQSVAEGERFFWNTTTGWMMWNYALGSLLCNAVLCIYDGSPSYPDLGVQWRFAADKKINHFGHGAPFLIQSMKDQIKAVTQSELPQIKTIGSTGAPLSEAAFVWLQDRLPNAQIISLSGGTDVCSAFLGGHPQLPVYAGYLQCAMLGAAVEGWNPEGEQVWKEKAELVLTQPMPCMPLYFWGDTNKKRYNASYFEKFENVWTHGDWIYYHPKRGIQVLGRSDATLNKNGIRIGTAELYNALDLLPELEDHLVVDLPTSKSGGSWLLLFLVGPASLDDVLKNKIRKHLREHCSPRHIPDQMILISEIPYTLSGKKLEIPVKKILQGSRPEKVVSSGALKNPKSIAEFVAIRDQLFLG